MQVKASSGWFFNPVLPAEPNKFHSCKKTGLDVNSGMQLLFSKEVYKSSPLFSEVSSTPVQPRLAVMAVVPQCLLLPLLSAADHHI